MRKIHWGVIGCGGIAARHTTAEFKQMVTNAAIVSVMDVSGAWDNFLCAQVAAWARAGLANAGILAADGSPCAGRFRGLSGVFARNSFLSSWLGDCLRHGSRDVVREIVKIGGYVCNPGSEGARFCCLQEDSRTLWYPPDVPAN
ncbi:MAG: hypothetical protein ABSF45_16220 [Terriglobia bacterium]|jgi:hypothetical protein